MNYCSIQDAWGKPNTISNQLKEYNNTVNTVKKKEVHGDDTNKNNHYNEEVEHFADVKSEKIPSYYTDRQLDRRSELRNDVCMDIMNHIKNCRVCSNNLRKQYRSPLLDNLNNIIDDNRETIVLILMGISILLFFNLINNMTKS